MIQGLKLAFTGQEIIRAIDERIAGLQASIQFKHDEIDGKVEHTGEVQWQVPVVQTLTMYRERIVLAETYCSAGAR